MLNFKPKPSKFGFFYRTTLQKKSPLCIHFLGIAQPKSQFLHSCVCERFIYSQDLSTYFPAAEQADRSWKHINVSQIYECRILETEHYNSVLEITVSFKVIHKWEPDIYIGLSPALHLQCRLVFLKLLKPISLERQKFLSSRLVCLKML